jgi:8-oxo-dGTP pyrophosphatase MutT (NUDIX family)
MKQMYKVFLNDRLIEIGDSANITKTKPLEVFNEPVTVSEVEAWFQGFVESSEAKVFLVHPSPERFFKIFRRAFTELPAAGGVVISADKLLFIFRNGKWDLPKGKIDAGETPDESALREVAEECGISAHFITKALPSTFHIYPSTYRKTKGQWIFKETFWFEMQHAGKEEPAPQYDEGITRVKWFSRGGLHEVLENTYENLKQIILLYHY